MANAKQSLAWLLSGALSITEQKAMRLISRRNEVQYIAIPADSLPAVMWPKQARVKQFLEQAGIQFLGSVEGDPLFQRARLPAGWRKVATNVEWLTMLVDDKNRERAQLIYFSTHYGRGAALVLTCRYGIRERCREPMFPGHNYDPDLLLDLSYEVTDGGGSITEYGHQVIFTTRRIFFRDHNYCRVHRQAWQQAKDWLNARYPGWENPFAYWD